MNLVISLYTGRFTFLKSFLTRRQEVERWFPYWMVVNLNPTPTVYMLKCLWVRYWSMWECACNWLSLRTMIEEQLTNCTLALATSIQICTWMSEFWLEICFSQQWCSSGLTCAAGGVDGLVSLDEDVAWIEGHQDDFLKLMVRELSLQVHIQLYVVILTEFNSKDLCLKRRSIRESRMGITVDTD